MLFILLLLFIRTTSGGVTDAAFAIDFMSQVNQARNTGCVCEGKYMPPAGTVKWHSKLEISATLHANQMVRYRFFEHYSHGGMDIGERVHAVGYPWRTIGENLGRGQKTIDEVIHAWKKSPSHCRLLMNPKFLEMGAAHVGPYWVLHMGAQKQE